jgi:hypothetical protein
VFCSSDFLLVNCNLLYLLGSNNQIRQDSYKYSLLNDACPSKHFRFSQEPDTPPWAQKSFHFVYPHPSKLNNPRISALMSGNASYATTEAKLSVYLQCELQPCLQVTAPLNRSIPKLWNIYLKVSSV